MIFAAIFGADQQVGGQAVGEDGSEAGVPSLGGWLPRAVVTRITPGMRRMPSSQGATLPRWQTGSSSALSSITGVRMPWKTCMGLLARS